MRLQTACHCSLPKRRPGRDKPLVSPCCVKSPFRGDTAVLSSFRPGAAIALCRGIIRRPGDERRGWMAGGYARHIFLKRNISLGFWSYLFPRALASCARSSSPTLAHPWSTRRPGRCCNDSGIGGVLLTESTPGTKPWGPPGPDPAAALRCRPLVWLTPLRCPFAGVCAGRFAVPARGLTGAGRGFDRGSPGLTGDILGLTGGITGPH